MQTVHRKTASQLSRNYQELAQLARQRQPVILMDDKGRDDMVLLSIEEYNTFAHKIYLREELGKAETYAKQHPDSWLDENEWKKQVTQIRHAHV